MKPIFLCSLFATALIASCGEPAKWPMNGSSDYVVQLNEDAPSGFRATLPDGSVFTDPEAYARYMPSIARQLADEGRDVAFVLGDQTCGGYRAPGSVRENGQCLSGGGPLPFGYYFSYQILGSKKINGCVNAMCTPGGAVRLHRNGSQLWDMHVGKFFRNGRTCLGMYESQGGWCRSSCSPTANDVKQGLSEAAVAVGVVAAGAWLMAEAMGPFLIPALAL